MMSEYLPLEQFKAVYVVDLCHSLCEQAKAKVGYRQHLSDGAAQPGSDRHPGLQQQHVADGNMQLQTAMVKHGQPWSAAAAHPSSVAHISHALLLLKPGQPLQL